MCSIATFFYCFSILNINVCTQHIDLKGPAAVKRSSIRLKPLLATLGGIAEAVLQLLPESSAIAILFVKHWDKKPAKKPSQTQQTAV